MAVTVEVHVSPDGNDNADGSLEQPFASLARARDAVKETVHSSLSTQGATVWIHGGDYRLFTPFTLNESNSGTVDAPITYRAVGEEKPRLLGGIEIPASTLTAIPETIALRLPIEARSAVRQVDLLKLEVPTIEQPPDAFKGNVLPELFIDGNRMPLARWPNEDWVTFSEIVDRGSRTGTDTPPRGGTFVYNEDRPARWSVEDGVWLQGYWCWDWYEESLRIKTIDPLKKQITLAAPHPYGIGYDPDYVWNNAPRRYFAFNLLEELDSPGEWFIDVQSMTLYVWPPEDLHDSEILLSIAQNPLIVLDSVSHVSIQGLTFEAGRATGITIKEGQQNSIAGCTFRNLGTGAVAISGGANHKVNSCNIHDVGSFGISLSGGDRQTLTPGGHEATNNHIYRFARVRRTYAGAVHLYGVGNRAAHNLIHDAPHIAMEFIGNDHVIEFNHIHHVAQETGDVGAIYTGRDWTARGNIIRHNFIHNLSGPGVVGSMAIYLDDCICGTMVFGNVIHGTTYGIDIGGGRDNVFRNNIVTTSRHAVHIDARCANMGEDARLKPVFYDRLAAVPYQEPPWSNRYPKLVNILDDDVGIPKRNIVENNIAAQCDDWLHLPGMDPYVEMNRIGDNLVFEKLSDVGFIDAEKLNLQLRDNSIVYQDLVGFERIPFEKIGMYENNFRQK